MFDSSKQGGDKTVRTPRETPKPAERWIVVGRSSLPWSFCATRRAGVGSDQTSACHCTNKSIPSLGNLTYKRPPQ